METKIDSENYFDAATGLYFYCSDWHGGMSSDEYRILCRLQSELNFRPGMSEPDEGAQVFIDELEGGRDMDDFWRDLVDAVDALEK